MKGMVILFCSYLAGLANAHVVLGISPFGVVSLRRPCHGQALVEVILNGLDASVVLLQGSDEENESQTYDGDAEAAKESEKVVSGVPYSCRLDV